MGLSRIFRLMARHAMWSHLVPRHRSLLSLIAVNLNQQAFVAWIAEFAWDQIPNRLRVLEVVGRCIPGSFESDDWGTGVPKDAKSLWLAKSSQIQKAPERNLALRGANTLTVLDEQGSR